MSSSSFYRRQADDYLRKAEAAEAIERIRELPVGSVVAFDIPRMNGAISYVALLINEEHSFRMRGHLWFFSQSGRTSLDERGTDAFISWLINSNAENIRVASFISLEDWNK